MSSADPAHLTSVLLQERDMLRSELADLKSCQLRYFSLSVAATGVLFGVASGSDQKGTDWLLFLTPLAVILPCWSIFFDKATTVSRIVGYVRVLEQILRHGVDNPYRYVGWENALAELRSLQKVAPSTVGQFFVDLVMAPCHLAMFWRLRTTHRYWVINWSTFFALALASTTLAALSLPYLPAIAATTEPSRLCNAEYAVFAVAALLALHSAGATARVLWSLCRTDDDDGGHGGDRRSYGANEGRWRELLDTRRDPTGAP